MPETHESLSPSPSQPSRSETRSPELTFLNRVSEIGGLDQESAEKAVGPVLAALQRHLTEGEAKKLEQQLPAGIQNLLQAYPLPGGHQAERFGKSKFFEAITEELETSPRRVGPIVLGVLTAAREAMAPEPASHIANQLPEDLKLLWEYPTRFSKAPGLKGVQYRRARQLATPEQRKQRRESRTRNTYLAFLKNLAEISQLSFDDAEDAALAVLRRLEDRLTANEANDLEAQLPDKLKELLETEEREKKTPIKYTLSEFYEAIADDAGVSPSEAIPLVSLVFRAVNQQISRGESEDVASQLPQDLAQVWLRAALFT